MGLSCSTHKQCPETSVLRPDCMFMYFHNVEWYIQGLFNKIKTFLTSKFFISPIELLNFCVYLKKKKKSSVGVATVASQKRTQLVAVGHAVLIPGPAQWVKDPVLP